jgi:hypothetical protein
MRVFKSLCVRRIGNTERKQKKTTFSTLCLGTKRGALNEPVARIPRVVGMVCGSHIYRQVNVVIWLDRFAAVNP